MTEANQQTSKSTIIDSDAKCILLDVEGTTSSAKFVYEVLFPFARAGVREFLKSSWALPATEHALNKMAQDAGFDDSQSWFTSHDLDSLDYSKAHEEIVVAEVNRLMNDDIKATGLKELQGLIWDLGYTQGKLSSHVYPDVPVAMKAWRAAGLEIRIYSSGSVQAQKAFYKHTEYGDLTKFITA